MPSIQSLSKQECIPVGCVPSAAVAVFPATHAPCLAHPHHVRSPNHACPSTTHAPPLWTEFLTHACENITFPQLLLLTVKMFVHRSFERFYPELTQACCCSYVKHNVNNPSSTVCVKSCSIYHAPSLLSETCMSLYFPVKSIDYTQKNYLDNFSNPAFSNILMEGMFTQHFLHGKRSLGRNLWSLA